MAAEHHPAVMAEMKRLYPDVPDEEWGALNDLARLALQAIDARLDLAVLPGHRAPPYVRTVSLVLAAMMAGGHDQVSRQNSQRAGSVSAADRREILMDAAARLQGHRLGCIRNARLRESEQNYESMGYWDGRAHVLTYHINYVLERDSKHDIADVEAHFKAQAGGE